MSKHTIDLKHLTPEQVEILDTWYALDSDNLTRLQSVISKTSLIYHLDDRYHLSQADARALLTLSDLVAALINTSK